MREFNVTGLCVAEKHYMVDISEKLDKIIEMINKGAYFTINRPRQFGKTTTFRCLVEKLSEEYIVVRASFEGIGDSLFSTEEEFCRTIFDVFAKGFRFTNRELYELLRGYSQKTKNFNELSENITNIIEDSHKDMILIIDEVDKSSGNRVFMQFLGMLRDKYLAMSASEDLTFKSVILGGVNDIKNIKLKIREDRDRVFNSPWNIAADFKVDMSFSTEEIKSMLLEYAEENHVDMDIDIVARELRYFTNGYPYLVSRLCKNIDEYLGREWTREGIQKAIKMTLTESNTLFDDVLKNVENFPEIKRVVSDILVEGKQISFNPFVYEKGIMYGIFQQEQGNLVIHNKIFETLLYDYLMLQEDVNTVAAKFSQVEKSEVIDLKGNLDMEKVLLKFQEFMYEQYREEDEKFRVTNTKSEWLEIEDKKIF